MPDILDDPCDQPVPVGKLVELLALRYGLSMKHRDPDFDEDPLTIFGFDVEYIEKNYGKLEPRIRNLLFAILPPTIEYHMGRATPCWPIVSEDEQALLETAVNSMLKMYFE